MSAVGSNLGSSQPTQVDASGNQSLSNLAASVKNTRARLPLKPTVGEQLRQQAQNSPQNLARILEEIEREKLKRAGGGGGGLRTFKNPALFVLYSLRIINQKMRAIFESFLKATAIPNQSTEIALPQNPVAEIIGKIANLPKQLLQSFQNGFINLLALPSQIGKNAVALAKTLASSFTNLATLAASALANKLFKNLFGQDDDKGIDREEELEKQGWLYRVQSFFLSDDTEHESNGRNIISHIRNVADQISKFLKRGT